MTDIEVIIFGSRHCRRTVCEFDASKHLLCTLHLLGNVIKTSFVRHLQTIITTIMAQAGALR